jgi:hypothetical protein
VANHLRQYYEAPTKKHQSEIINKIINLTQDAAGLLGGFVQLDEQGFWFKISPKAVCEKIGHTIRYFMSDEYHIKAILLSLEGKCEDKVQRAQNRILSSVLAPLPIFCDKIIELNKARQTKKPRLTEAV